VWPGRPELKYRECGHVSQHVTGYNVTIIEEEAKLERKI
jgi:hypothetical protein